mmetsp:Transcript_11786/g.49522  ORF Transcript_11786/g.49522 Transcript_11786/m.49522 type:complete len:318 (+) Transcript_11786:387-1340(+)
MRLRSVSSRSVSDILAHEVEDLRRERRGLVDGEPRVEQRGVEEELRGGDRAGGVAGGESRVEVQNHGRARVDLHRLLALHVLLRAVVAHGLRLHDALHVRGPAKLGRDEDARRVRQALGHRHLLNLTGAESFLEEIRERLHLLLDLGLALLLVFVLVAEVEILLGDVHELLLLVLRQVGHRDFVDGVDHEQNLVPLLGELFEERRVLRGGAGVRGDVVDVGLALRHGLDVRVQALELASLRLAGLEPEEGTEGIPVGGVFDDSQFEVTAERVPERVVIAVIPAGDVLEHVQRLTDEPLAHDSDDAGLLENLAADVQR